MPLTEMEVRNARPREKPYKLSDGEQMYLLVHPNGSRYWRLDYALKGKRKTAALGIYPAVGLKEARTLRDRMKVSLKAGEPIVADQTRKGPVTFGDVASDWLNRKVRPDSSPATIEKTEWLLRYTAPFSKTPITEVRAPDVLAELRKIEARGHLESARRLRSICSRIFRFAVATGDCEVDVCAALRGALTPPKVVHHAAPLTPEKIGALMRTINDYQGYPVVKAALQLGALTFVRPFELRYAVWEEFDLDEALWRIPAERMKMGRAHIVPLSRQSLAVLRRLLTMYDPVGLVFPALRRDDRPISDSTVNGALRILGFSRDEATHHGFRRMASTILNERGWNYDWIERQLAHVESNAVRRAYNAAQYLEGRTTMMQAWADLLDEFAGVEEEEDLIG